MKQPRSFPDPCVPQLVKTVDYWDYMTKVIHAKRTTAVDCAGLAHKPRLPLTFDCVCRVDDGDRKEEEQGRRHKGHNQNSTSSIDTAKRIVPTAMVPSPCKWSCINGGTCRKANMLKAKLCLIIKNNYNKNKVEQTCCYLRNMSVCRRQTWPKVGLFLTSHQWEMFYFVTSPKGKLPHRPRDFGSYKHC